LDEQLNFYSFPFVFARPKLLKTHKLNSITIRTMEKQKYYVVWKGRKRGIFTSWTDCNEQVKGYTGARYKSFGTRIEAEAALADVYVNYAGRPSTLGKWKTARIKPFLPSLCVDAACSGSPGILEYQGLETGNGKRIFHAGPFADGTNNVGEFLAIVRAIEHLSKHKLDWPIYSDSENAIIWVKAGKCNTKLARLSTNIMLFELISRAEQTLKGSKQFNVLKWDTEDWGENPADFGRK
jgi:ribonuclease HI